jgi:hypothetical protein
MLFVHIALIVAGLGLCMRRGVVLGQKALVRPAISLVGILLIAQFPVAMLGAMAAGAQEGLKLAEQGVTEISPLQAKKIEKKYMWVSPAVTLAFVILAGIVAMASLRRLPSPEEIPEEEGVAGIRDMVAEQEELDREAKRQREVWAGRGR